MVHLARPPLVGAEARQDPETEQHVLEAIRERGALPSRAFEGAAKPGEMWSWKPAKAALEHLFAAGELVVAGRDGLPARLRPARARDPAASTSTRPTPSEEEFRRGYALRAVAGPRRAHRVRHRRALPLPGRREGDAADRRRARRATGSCGGSRSTTAERRSSSRPTPSSTAAPAGGVLLSPFDNLLWDKPFVERVFGFAPLIEVYKREHERDLRLLRAAVPLGDRLVGRADLKSDRGEGVLRVQGVPPRAEGAPLERLDDAFDRALARLARALGLERVAR